MKRWSMVGAFPATPGRGLLVDQAGLWRACRRLLRSLDIEPPLDMGEVCRRVAAVRGRPIHLVEFPLTSSLALAWDAGAYDVIAWRPHTSRWHRDHSIAHELGHYLCGHLDPEGARTPRPRRGSPPDSDLGPVRPGEPIVPSAGLRPSCRDTAHEESVERVATVLVQWTGLGAPSSAVQGLGRSLSWRRGWL